ncbi:hypothetical protein COLO4_27451 [Corchorus olitorius]|uniref:Uncharacterized protein n=1 Tax=Corchorus olitorius TaxID=93759 RepID=A0A1R3HQY8_9ROSI|nr:hypothetical protein COLO4_27451 [Corchorus olitorius]
MATNAVKGSSTLHHNEDIATTWGTGGRLYSIIREL